MPTVTDTSRTAAPAETDAETAARLRLAVMRLARLLRGQDEESVTTSQLSALATLEGRGPLPLGELSGIERVKPPTMTRVVASLEDQGLVVRTIDDLDRRVARVAVTEAGRALLARSRRRRNAFLAARLGALTEAERAAVRDATDALERLLEAE